MINTDLLPYWTVDSKRYYNQFDVWLAIGSRDISTAQFHLYESSFDSLDWTQEPATSWDDLVLLRCLQVRNKYKHLCLLYSAGRDSHHMLRSFANNKIPLDEIVVVDHTLSPLKHPEVDSWMIPLAQQYVKNYNPACKITRINVDFHDFESYFTESWSEDPVMSSMNGQYQPANYSWLVTQHLGSRLPSGTGVITGVDKPRLELKDGWIESAFHDTMFSWYASSNLAFEFFYISPNLPEMYVKQCHMVINWWEKNMPNIDSETIDKFIGDPHSGHYDNYNLACGRGTAVDLTFQGQNGRNKNSANHAVFKIIQRQARENNWRNFNYWTENYNWLKSQVPHAFDFGTRSGFKNYDSNVFNPILSKSRRLRTWNTQS
jgi:hypothetical protein